jgi:BASS family bile acid:Na+ symporter
MRDEGRPRRDRFMSIERITSLLVTVTLIELMVAVGLSVRLTELASVARDWRLTVGTLLANYLAVPAITVGLLLLFRPHPMVAAGFLILAVCPGAPFGPPYTAMAKGNVVVAVGLMVVLAGSSAATAPILLAALLKRLPGDAPLTIDALKIAVTLLATQLAPLCVGLAVRQWRPAAADRLQRPAAMLSKLLNLAVVVVILGAQYRTLAEITPRAFVGMLVLLLASLTAGYILSVPDPPRAGR